MVQEIFKIDLHLRARHVYMRQSCFQYLEFETSLKLKLFLREIWITVF